MKATPAARLPRIKVHCEDFRVDELPRYEPSGEGGHTFVLVEKRDLDTEALVRALARAAGVAARDIGRAGMKDRRAVTTQWLSLPDVAPEAALALELPGAHVLEARRHRHKLRTGHLAGNRFAVRVRELPPGAFEEAAAAAGAIRQSGLANRFGPQRFGAAGDNAARGRELLGGAAPGRDRRRARLLLSALQAEVFNRVLAERPLALDAVEAGDVARVTDSGGLFVVEDAPTDCARAARFEISATGPIFGTKVPEPRGAVREREASALAACGVPPAAEWRLARGLSLPGARRPLRVPVPDLALAREGEDAASVLFTLPPGSYATVLVEALFGEVAVGPAERPSARRAT